MMHRNEVLAAGVIFPIFQACSGVQCSECHGLYAPMGMMGEIHRPRGAHGATTRGVLAVSPAKRIR